MVVRLAVQGNADAIKSQYFPVLDGPDGRVRAQTSSQDRLPGARPR